MLLVEGERKLRELGRAYLERAGYLVLSTGPGAEAISLATGSSWPGMARPGGGPIALRLALAFVGVALTAVACSPG